MNAIAAPSSYHVVMDGFRLRAFGAVAYSTAARTFTVAPSSVEV